MIILAVDLGDVRTGVAVCDKYEILAAPVGVIKETSKNKLLEKVAAVAREKNAELIVVGNPKNMNATEGERAKQSAVFANSLEQATGVKTVLWDERLTTVSAHNALNLTNTRGKKRKAVIDAVSATFILEDYLSYRRAGNGYNP